MWSETALTRKLGIAYPIIQAPMAGGATTPALVAAVSNAGGLGTLAGGYIAPDALRAAIREVRARTKRPFAVNLLVSGAVEASPAQLERAAALLRPAHDALGLPPAPAPASFAESLDEQIAVVREERVAILSFAFGLPDAATLAALKGDGTLLIGTATTVPEAVALEAAGIDLVVAQGSEAGGHRGTFLDPFEAAMIGTLALTPQLADAVDIPVIAAGGIMDGRGIVAALALGAAGAQLGTAFLAGPESAAPPAHKAALLSGTVETVVTRAFSGKPVRAIRNRLVDELAAHEAELPPYPIQNGLTRDIRQAATRQGRPEYMGMWAGQAAALSRDLPAGELVATLVREVEATLGRLGS